MALPKKITSDFAILDVRSGRKKLASHFEEKDPKPVSVVIEGFIKDTWSGDDGTSIEFQVDVNRVEIKEIDDGQDD